MGEATGGGDLIGRLRGAHLRWFDCIATWLEGMGLPENAAKARLVGRDVREAADALEECRSALQRLERRWKDIDLNKVFTFSGDVEAMQGLFAVLAKLEGGHGAHV